MFMRKRNRRGNAGFANAKEKKVRNEIGNRVKGIGQEYAT